MFYSPEIAQASPFPLMEERPTSSQMSMTSNKGRNEEKPKKTASATKKEKSAGKARKEKGEDKKKKKSKTDVKNKKAEKEDESRSNTSPLSSYSEMDATGANLNDAANSSLKERVIFYTFGDIWGKTRYLIVSKNGNGGLK